MSRPIELLVASLLVGCALSAQSALGQDPVAEPERIDVLLKEADLLYQIFLSLPGEGQPRLTRVEQQDADNHTWTDISEQCVFSADKRRVGFLARLSGQLRLVFSDQATGKTWVSAPIEVRDGRADGATDASVSVQPPAVAGTTVAQHDIPPDQIALSFTRSDSGYVVGFDAAVLGESLNMVEVKDPEGAIVQSVDPPGAPRDPADPSPVMYDRASRRLSFNAAYPLVFESLTENIVFVFTDDRGARYESRPLPKSVIAPVASNAAHGASLPFTAGLNTSALRAQLGDVPELDKLVLTSARTWQFHPTGGSLVFRYDHYPEATAKKIAEVLGKTAKDLENPAMTVDGARSKMKEYFEQFYESGDRPYSVINVHEEDWKPFLKHLQEEVEKQVKVPDDPAAAKDMWKLVVVELADGFEQLAKEIVDGKTVVDGGTVTASGGGATYGTSDSGRRRVSCWNLLFGL